MTKRKLSQDVTSDIAIVGMAVNLPGAPGLEDFWNNLADGVESITRLDPAALKAAGESPANMRRDAYVPAAGLLDGYDMFDAEFFGFSPKEAAILDPQHRKFLETAWEALENAGHTADEFAGRVGVFAGCGAGSYLYFNLFSNPDLVDDLGPFQLRNTGNDKDFLSTRVSHVLDLKGPSINIQTACSTALVGVHQAAKALADGDCDMALAGGVSVEMPQGRGYIYRENDILSPDGHCRAFDHKAGGSVMGSGAGAVVLRRLEDALEDGDHIWAVIKGTGLNNDGADKAGFFAPSEAGQAEVVGRALDAAGVAPESIAYVECHGTGTLLGDPFEVAGLTQAYRARGVEADQFCGIGSVQTNVGNLDTAAAVTGLVKTALSLKHGQIPPSLNYEAPNPMIDFAASPFYVNDRLADWPKRDTPRRAAVNTLGVGGTNAHAVLEQAPEHAASDPGLFPFQPIVLSARSDAALDEMSATLAQHLRAHPDQPLADVAFTLMQGRKAFEKRRVLVAETHAQAADLLAAGESARVFTHDRLGTSPDTVFLFPGAPEMSRAALRDLFETEPVFSEWAEKGLAALGKRTKDDIAALLFAQAPSEKVIERLARPALRDPINVINSVALAQLAMSWGIAQSSLLGASLGEISAAVVAGVMTLEDAVGLAHWHGRLEETTGAEARTKVRAELRAFAGNVELKTPKIPLVSGRTGAALTAAQAQSLETWVNAGADQSRLEVGLATLTGKPDRVFLTPGAEIAVTRRLLGTGGVTPAQLLALVPEPNDATPGDIHFIGTLTRLWALGIEADWGQFWAGAKRQRLPLPGYRFQRSRYLIEPGRAAAGPETVSQDLIRLDDMTDWGWRPVWHPAYATCEVDTAQELHRAPKQTWLIFEDVEGIAATVGARLSAAGHTVVRVNSGDSFAKVGDRRYTLMSEQGREGYEALLNALAEDDMMPSRIAHFWGVSAAETHRLGSDPFHDNMEYGFFSLTYLAKALGRVDLPGPIHVTAITRNATSVNNGPVACPEKATIAGPAGVMARELPGVTCATLDLEPELAAPAKTGLFSRRAKPDWDALSTRLLEDLLAEPSNEVAAFRGDRRYRQSYTKAPLAPAGIPAFREGGTYLLTGGLGDLGLDLARSLLTRHKATLVLVNRRTMPPRESWDEVLRRSPPGDRTAAAIQGVQALEQLGGEIEIAAADVTNLNAMQALVDSVIERHGRIDGVLHAAGVLGDGPLLDRDIQEIEGVFAPKIDGLRVLDELFPDGSTDFMVLFSSTTTATRNAGELDFIAANEYLNAYAKSRQGGKTKVVSLGWGVWSEIGMIARALDPVDPSELPRKPLDVPLIGSAGYDRDGARSFRSTWEARRAWVFAQHKNAAGTGIMPASGVAEIAAEAFLSEGGAMPFDIRNLHIKRQFLSEGGSAQTTARLSWRGGTWHCEVQSEVKVDGRDGRATHAVADVTAVDVVQPPRIHLGEIAVRSDRETAKSAGEGGHLSMPKEAHLALGAAWKGLRDVVLGDGEGLARLKLPEAAKTTFAPGMILHPGLLDSAMSWAIELAPNYSSTGVWLAESIGSIRVYAPLPAEFASWVRVSQGEVPLDTALFDVTLCDLEGKVLVEIRNLVMKRVDPVAGLEPSGLTAAEVTFAEVALPQGRSATQAQLAWNMTQGIRAGEGLEAMERSLALDLPQVLVTSLDLQGLIAEADRAEPVAAAAGQTFARPALAVSFAAPETETEQALSEEWSKFLGIAEIGIDDDFFDLGGHSLIAVRLCANVNKVYGTDYGLAVLAEAPTIREWAARIDTETATGDDAAATAARRAFTHIVPLNRSHQKDATPVFLVSGMFGNVLNLRHVAQILGEDRPVYGLQAKGLLGDDEPLRTFEEAAASCLAEMRQIQPEGPYVVGGFSGGGITALEISRRLEQEGDRAALVIMFDTYKDHDPVIKRIDKALIKLAEFRRKGPGYFAEWVKNRIAWEFQKRKKHDVEAEGTFHNHEIEMAFRDAIHAYEPQSYDVNAVLLRPALDKFYKVSRGNWITSEKRYVSDDNDWGGHIPKLEVVEMPGDHGSMVLVPNVGVVGTYLRSRIDTALRRPGQVVHWDAREAAE